MKPARLLAVFALACAAFADPDKPAPEKQVAKTPEEAAKQFETALKQKDKARTWELMSADSRKILEEQVGDKMKSAEGEERTELAEELGVSEEDYAKLSSRDLVISMLFARYTAQNAKQEMKLAITDVKVDGDKAEAKTTFGQEEPSTSHFVKEDGEWKFDVKRDMDDAGRKPPPPDQPPDKEKDGDGK
jgi:hypothetical protein